MRSLLWAEKAKKSDSQLGSGDTAAVPRELTSLDFPHSGLFNWSICFENRTLKSDAPQHSKHRLRFLIYMVPVTNMAEILSI